MGTGLNVAVTALAALIGTEQAPVPVQAPLQPANVEPLAGVAVRATIAAEANVGACTSPRS